MVSSLSPSEEYKLGLDKLSQLRRQFECQTTTPIEQATPACSRPTVSKPDLVSRPKAKLCNPVRNSLRDSLSGSTVEFKPTIDFMAQLMDSGG